MGAQLNTVWLVRWGRLSGALALTGCQAMWPRCQSNADCPTGYACRDDGRCIGVQTAATSSSSSSSSSSGGGSSSSTPPSSGPQSSSAVSVGSSSGTTSSSLVASSSVGASSSSGPFCGANDNVAADRPLDFTVGTEFTAESCRDGRDVVYYWRASGLNLRFKTEVRLDVDRFPVNAGRPLQPVFYNLTRGNGPELFGVFAGECRATNNPSESCIGYINQAMPDLFLEVRPRPLDGGEPYLATGRSTVAITALPCAPAPANTSPDAAIPFGCFGGADGASPSEGAPRVRRHRRVWSGSRRRRRRALRSCRLRRRAPKARGSGRSTTRAGA